MVWNSSELITSFPFAGGEVFFNSRNAGVSDIDITSSSEIFPSFPSHSFTRTSFFPSDGLMSNSSISNNEDIDPSSLSYSGPLTVFIVLASFSIFTLFGNSLVMLAVYREYSLKSPPNYFVASLAAADFFVGLLLLPFEAITQLQNRRWIFGEVWCDLWHSFDVLLTTASILNLCAISLDRYWAICTPFQYSRRMTPQKAYKFIALVWILAVVISVPAIFWWRLVRTGPMPPDSCPFTEDVYYLVSSSCISFYIPLCVMLFAYYKIYLAAVKQSKSIQQGAKMFPSKNDKKGMGDITLRMHRGGGNNGGNNGNNNTICGSTTLEHRKSFHFERSDPAGLTLLNGCKRSNTVKVRKGGGCTTYLMRTGSTKEKRVKSCSVSNSPNGEVIVPILLMSEEERTVLDPGDSRGSSSSPIISSTANNNIIAQVSTRSKSQNHLFPGGMALSFRRHSRMSFTVARKIAKFAKEKKAAKTLAIVLGIFIICWLPFFVMNIVFALCKTCAEPNIILFEIATYLGWINSAMNPVIYGLNSADFRRAFAKLLCCTRCLRARQRRKSLRRLSVV